MASACVNMAVNNFPSLSWLSPTTTTSAAAATTTTSTTSNAAGDFEFHLLDDSVTMLPADELFFDGKLLPLHFPKHPPSSSPSPENLAGDPKLDADGGDGGGDVTVLFSPKAPRCSSRWREILGLKTKPKTTMTPSKKTTSSDASSLTAPLLQRPSSDVSTSRRSLSSSSSSSSSGREHEDAALHHHHHLLLPRLSLDEQRKPREETHRHASRQRPPQLKTRGVSMDSPRMNPAGKIVFQSLERSSSSPSTFSGGPRYKYKGMERSYSANVRVTRVLNVPNGFGLGHLFSSSSSSSSNSQKKEKDNNSHNGRSERRRVHSHG